MHSIVLNQESLITLALHEWIILGSLVRPQYLHRQDIWQVKEIKLAIEINTNLLNQSTHPEVAEVSQLYIWVPSTCDSHVPLTEPPVPVPDIFDDLLCLPDDAEGSLEPLQCLLQGFWQFGPFGRNLLLLDGGHWTMGGGHWTMGVPVESRERGVQSVQPENEIAKNTSL